MSVEGAGRAVVVTAVATGCLILAVAPATAMITRYSAGGVQISLESDGADDLISIECVGGQARQGGVDILPCPVVQDLFARGNGGNDTVDYSSVTAAQYPALRRVDIDGGDGNDTISGSQLGDTIEDAYGDTVAGNDGPDRITSASTASGGPGDDVLVGIGQAVDGGLGDDRIEAPVNGPIFGGPGQDTVAFDFHTSAAGQGIAVTFVVDDENLHISAPSIPVEADVSMGAVERFEIDLFDLDTQVVDLTAFSGSSVVEGHGGPDVIRAGAGEDFLAGGPGPDQVTGGGGFDYVQGGPGDDTIDVRDGTTDRVRCGDGSDTVVADPGDLLEACESVQLPTAPAAAPTTPVVETGAVAGPRKVVGGKRAVFTFASPTVGASFQCRLDRKGAWRACASPYRLATRRLKPGKHTLQVRAVAGSPDATPAVRRFRVVAR